MEKRDERGSQAPSVTRRSLVAGVGATAVLCGLGSFRWLGTESLVRPPGGQDEEALAAKCVHCNRCIAVCPDNLIVPSRIENGVMNMRTPHMDYSTGNPGEIDNLKYCDFCARANGGVPLCVEACPSGALGTADDIDPATLVLGRAELDSDLCLAYRSSYCAFCYEACVKAHGEEDAAIYFKNAAADGESSTKLPVVDAEKCNGCGACEAICVSAQAGSVRDTQVRAIVVKPL